MCVGEEQSTAQTQGAAALDDFTNAADSSCADVETKPLGIKAHVQR